MVYALVPDDDPILHTRLEDFDFANQIVNPFSLVDDLIDTMKVHHGAGLAANQCGLPHRVFIFYGPEGQPVAAFNPILSEEQDPILDTEGCLTYPDLILSVKRPRAVLLRAKDAWGEEFSMQLSGWHARVVCHETDHLNGITFIEKVSKLKLDRARKKLRR